MPNRIMYQEESTYVILSPQGQEQFMDLAELQDLLRKLLVKLPELPQDLQSIPDLEQQVERLIKTTCELDCQEHGLWQWYVVRLNKP